MFASIGFPHSEIPGSQCATTPRGLSQLAASFIAYLRQGIHTHALSSLTIKFTLNTECSSARYNLCILLPVKYSVFKDRWTARLAPEATNHPINSPCRLMVDFWLP